MPRPIEDVIKDREGTPPPIQPDALNAFGPGRVMVGSDWPVCLLSGGYGQVMEILARHVEQFSEQERQALLGANCACFYQIR